MKKIVITIILIYLTSFSVNGQYVGPKSIVVGDTITNNYQVIYPLGWSEDGVFAYIHQDINPLGAAEIYFYTVIFQNMKTGKILWILNIEYDLENNNDNRYHYSEDGTTYNYAFFKQIVWNSYGQKIEDKLKLYNIERTDSSLHKLTDLPKDISLKESGTKNDSEISVRYNIKLFKPQKFKPVYNYDCTRTKDSCDVNESIWYKTFAVKGYFKSPFEIRIAILVFKETNGFEEPYEYPFFVGTHLEKGFMDRGCKQ